MPQNVSGHLFPRTPGVHWAGELVTWAAAGAGLSPERLRASPAASPLSSWTLNLHLTALAPLPASRPSPRVPTR